MKGAAKTSGKYDIRAPPRKRPKSEFDEQPVFLRKAFAMISACPAEIGGWSEAGDTVVIKDAKAFAEKIIPTAYKHNHFSSFVRQLNFYGFRKVKSDVMHNSEWWEFRHPHFVRGQPHLLSEIKRSVHFESNSGEVSDLKHQINELTDRVSKLSDLLEELSFKVGDGAAGSSTPSAAARRKVRARIQSPRSGAGSSISIEDPMGLIMDDFDEDESPRDNAFALGGIEGAFLDDLIDLTSVPMTPIEGPRAAPESVAAQEQTIVASEPQPQPQPACHIASEVATVLTVLSPDLQQRFLDKLAESMGAQLAALSVQNCDKAGGLTLPSGQAPEIALPLASAALGAFVMSSLHSTLGAGPVVSKKAATISA